MSIHPIKVKTLSRRFLDGCLMHGGGTVSNAQKYASVHTPGTKKGVALIHNPCK